MEKGNSCYRTVLLLAPLLPKWSCYMCACILESAKLNCRPTTLPPTRECHPRITTSISQYAWLQTREETCSVAAIQPCQFWRTLWSTKYSPLRRPCLLLLTSAHIEGAGPWGTMSLAYLQSPPLWPLCRSVHNLCLAHLPGLARRH